jgi:ATP-dependent protease ClpP protease subunit
MIQNRTLDQIPNWERAVFVDGNLDDNLTRQLTPQILSLRQSLDEPITVGINSPGGSLSSLETLIGLLSGPLSNTNRGHTITVATENAYSAAASLLASGTYAIALPHSEILFHDVRHGGMEDITPDAAKKAVSQLQNINDEFSVKLANRIFRRFVFNYIELKPLFSEISTNYNAVLQKYEEAVNNCDGKNTDDNGVDVASFATILEINLSRENANLVKNSIARLNRWGLMTSIASSFSSDKKTGNQTGILLKGPKKLFDLFSKAIKLDPAETVWNRSEEHIQIAITLLIEHVVKSGFSENYNFGNLLENVLDDFRLIDSTNKAGSWTGITRHLIRHEEVFFSPQFRDIPDEEARKNAIIQALPSARLFWQFCVAICRELFNGEHHLSPLEAQVLGIVDEVPGQSMTKNVREKLAQPRNL